MPPPCRKCGATTHYYSGGLCQRCHRFAPQVIDSCVDCHGWGVTRTTGWLCEGCRGWRKRFPTPSTCPSCERDIALNAEGLCRLCWRQTAGKRPHGGAHVRVATQYGQQLFIANLFRQKRPKAPPNTPQRLSTRNYPVRHEQLVLFTLPRALDKGHRLGFPEPPDRTLALMLDQAARQHARTHGWSATRLTAARQGIRILLSLQDTPGAAIKASEVRWLEQLSLALQPILDILTATDMLHDDRKPSLIPWFARQVDGLPEPMATEVRTWFDVLHRGSTTPPRSRPRSTTTVRLRVRYAAPVLHEWSAAGHQSLREITREHIRTALPAEGNDRSLVGQALRSLFRLLKARRLVFTDPTTRFRTGRPQPRDPLPVQTSALREALHSPQPARAVLAALVGFHALRNGQLRGLQLTDVRDTRLYLPDRTILLAPPVRDRIADWLDHRTRRWPQTVNPHLLINTYTAVRTGQVSHLWINDTLGLSSQAVREDRILDEATASGGDIRRLCDLFGLSIKAAERYTATLEHPDLRQSTSRDGLTPIGQPSNSRGESLWR